MKKITLEDTFFSTVRDLEKHLLSSNLIIMGVIDSREEVMRSGKRISGSKIFEVFDPDLLYEALTRNQEAGIHIPVRIYVYEEKSISVIEYEEVEELLKDYDLGDIGHAIDIMIMELLKKVIGGRSITMKKQNPLAEDQDAPDQQALLKP